MLIRYDIQTHNDLKYAEELFASGKFPQAERIYQEMDAHHPNDFTVAARLGYIALDSTERRRSAILA